MSACILVDSWKNLQDFLDRCIYNTFIERVNRSDGLPSTLPRYRYLQL